MKTRPDITVGTRRYHDTRGRCWPVSQQCEHCDGVDSDYVRNDDLRGLVCPPCDVALDEMFGEPYTCECPTKERRQCVVTDHDGNETRVFYCDDCVALAQIDWNGETAKIEVMT